MRTVIHKLVKSFSYAFDGLRYTYRTQLNMKIHMLAAAIVALLTLYLPLSLAEVLFVTAAAFAVIICELANTVVETIVDMISPYYNPLAKIAKDVAAAAVMVSAFFALVTGAVVFTPFVVELFETGLPGRMEVTFPSVIAGLVLIFLAIGACMNGIEKRYASSVENSGNNDNDHTKTGGNMDTNDKRVNNGNNHADMMDREVEHPVYHRQKRVNAMSKDSMAVEIAVNELKADEQELLMQAIQARENAYAPYSGFRVGSAVRSADGHIFAGCNIENSAYGSTNCAERSALYHAISRGVKPKKFQMLAVAGDTERPITPCGACRQVISELCDPDMPVILANMKGKAVVTTVSALLPGAFTDRMLHQQGE